MKALITIQGATPMSKLSRSLYSMVSRVSQSEKLVHELASQFPVVLIVGRICIVELTPFLFTETFDLAIVAHNKLAKRVYYHNVLTP